MVRFAGITGLFVAIYLISWKQVFSFDLWVLKDRGSFLNLDYLLDQHLRLGVDTFYSYGLLPVAIQHWLFALFGRGYWPLLGCAMLTLLLVALFCAEFLRHLPTGWIWVGAFLLFAKILNPVSPNLPYELVDLSMYFALLLVLRRRFDLALAAAAVGCWSVPSLPLVLCALLVLVIAVDWWIAPGRSLGGLIRAYVPGFIVYLGLGVVLALQFGWRSVLATATPLAGIGFYHQLHYGSARALREFLLPPYHTARFYLAHSVVTPVLWWVLSTIAFVAFAVQGIFRMARSRSLTPRDLTIVLCAIIQVVFISVAYGAPHQHYIYDPIVIIGVLLGLSAMPQGRLRQSLLVGFLVLGAAGQLVLARDLAASWRQTRSAAITANLFAERAWALQWSEILDLSKSRELLLFSYSTGAHHYFPAVHSPDVWTLQEGQLSPADRKRVLAQLDHAEIIVIDLTSPTFLIERDKEVQAHLYPLCLTKSTQYFQIWWRRPLKDGAQCIQNSRGF